MAEMSNAQRDEFLAGKRYAILTTLRADGSPVAVPVWYGWDGRSLKMFTHVSTQKMKRIRRDPRATVLVANTFGELEAWVAFDGAIVIHEDGGLELALNLADKYWEVDNPERAATLDEWRDSVPAGVCWS
jgi:PPOX class probable F420-dependent enzyme